MPVTGRQRGSAPDIKHPLLSLEVKHRKRLSVGSLLRMMEAAELLDVKVLRLHSKISGRSFCLTRLDTFCETINRSDRYLFDFTGISVVVDEFPTSVLEAYDQAEKSADYILETEQIRKYPCMIFHQERMKVEDSLVIMPIRDYQNFILECNNGKDA